ncbi:MAG: 2-oxo-4-hydroxy-4-carboxy-5-ureidoimidazoline decarboxylase [Armatimonadota bacterium]
MRDLPRKLTVGQLAALFAGRTRFVERLAECEHPLAAAPALLRQMPEDERIEAFNAHPAIGAPGLSATSAREQGARADPNTLDALVRLNRAYQEKFGFRFVVFVNRRPQAEILRVLEDRLDRSRDQEMETAAEELVAIAVDRYSRA